MFHQNPKDMKKIYFTLLILLSCTISLMATEFAGGTGTKLNPFQVALPAHLNNVRNYTDAWFLQTQNIDLSGYGNWVPIAANGTDKRFTGHYDGQGFTISNLTIYRPDVANVGLFGHVGMDDNGHTTLRNIKLVNVKVTGGRGTGALAGRVTGNQNTRIEYCSVDGGAEGFVKGNAAVGGLVGSNNSYRLNNANAESFRPVIFACWTNVDVSMAPNSDPNKIKYGGLTGCNQKGLISNSYALGSVTAGEGAERIGGLAGCVEFRGIIINSFAMGTVSGTDTRIGGLLGFGGQNQHSGTVISSYFLSVQPNNGEGVALSEVHMKIQSSFEDWDFANIWIMGTDNPTLRENPPVSTNIWTWTGHTDNDWNEAANWHESTIPSTDGNAVIVIKPENLIGANAWPTLGADFSIQDLTLGSGAKITLVGSLSISGKLEFDGDTQQPSEILTPDNGRLILAGQKTQQIPSLIFENLTIENPNNVNLAGDITVKGNLTLELGFLDLNGFTITLLGADAMLIEKEEYNSSSRVFGASGKIIRVQNISGEHLNIAGIGLGINTNKDMEVTIERGHSELAGSDEAKSIMRWFTITPTELPSELNATVTFHYFLGELQEADVNPALSLFKRVKDGDGWLPWEIVYSENIGEKKLVAKNVTSFSQWTASDASTPMPIVLLSFDGKAVEDAVALSWVTAAELNNDFFTIERSRDGVQFNSIGTKTGAGTTSQINHYKYMDHEPLDGLAYYRLKQTDFNGDFEYSKTISVYTRTDITEDIRLFPNPNNGHFRILTGGHKNINFQIYDMLGKMVYSKSAEPGQVTFVDLSGLQKGIYTVVFYGDEVIARKIQVY
ncbi:MAG: T9SS C-terminal target domain-containing protein [Bacteroidetes bacterium]|nr:MAG: T9SS C-terminal target domain-containing protein [Bacteroidota bacterium]